MNKTPNSEYQQAVKNILFELYLGKSPELEEYKRIVNDPKIEESLNAITAVIERLIGDNEPEFNTPEPDLPAMARNRLRESQRKALKMSKYNNESPYYSLKAESKIRVAQDNNKEK